MSIFEEPGAGLLIAAIALSVVALLSGFAISRWRNKPVRRDKAFRTAPPMQED